MDSGYEAGPSSQSDPSIETTVWWDLTARGQNIRKWKNSVGHCLWLPNITSTRVLSVLISLVCRDQLHSAKE